MMGMEKMFEAMLARVGLTPEVMQKNIAEMINLARSANERMAKMESMLADIHAKAMPESETQKLLDHLKDDGK